MFLLIPKAGGDDFFLLSGFTFHYVSINTLDPLLRMRDSFIFTFHYVSINTNKCSHHLLDSYIFTFHYVSINTFFITFIRLALTPLHSIMFLLILKRFLIWLYCYQLSLHSIMFLLIRRHFVVELSNSQNFTFHYVSINTL